MRKSNEFLGLDGFVWWTGVVEDRDDPLQLGRCKVRCMGWHDENIDKLPTNDLPWAQPLQPITSAALAGVGTSATGLLEGSWVVGFFMDGKEGQFPVIMGSLAGISGDGEVMGTGFRDPWGVYPPEDFKGKPDTPLAARGNETSKESPAYQDKIVNRLGGGVYPPVETAKGADVGSIYAKSIPKSGEWSEPEPRGSKDSEYPYNHVRKTESGHVFEVDDSIGAERIHTYHSVGTFEEIQPDGTKVTKVVGENYEIIAKGQNVSITGGCNITVNGDTRIKTIGDYIHEVSGNYHLSVDGDFVQKVGSYAQKVELDKITTTGGQYGMSVGGDFNAIVTGNINLNSSGSVDITALNDFTAFSAEGSSAITSGEDVQLVASKKVDLVALDGTLNLFSDGNMNMESDDGKMKIQAKETITIQGGRSANTITMGRTPDILTPDIMRIGELELIGGAKITNKEKYASNLPAVVYAHGNWENSDGSD